MEALARDDQCERWHVLCGRSVLQSLSRLTAEDPNGLRLSRAACAALSLGLSAREVHAVVPQCLRVGPGAVRLDLRKKGLGPEGAARIELPPSEKGLLELDLDLGKCGVRAVGAASLRFPAGIVKMRLGLNKCDIGPEGAKALALPTSLTDLELILSSCKIGPKGARDLRLPASLVNLDLSLQQCAIGDAGAKALVLPAQLRKLRLCLGLCGLGPEGLKSINWPERLQELSLDLGMCRIGADGTRSLATALPATLESLELELDGCGVSDQAVASFEISLKERLPGLRTCTVNMGAEKLV
eukprot:gnl/TRDRNA2_/TRDRNA2_48441_c0_seq2.p2 gnl/TRDRNA2_/TRDRNA2_48441_c0~~gnl/TRDRNA2_/TRDRNA2_48441_c0_seq2.p2  ORF type:complete len:299 (+),score=45.90 gnl/TRDRNA2_/TRDRNA2_48441_c0_seq2:608-1504(+)